MKTEDFNRLLFHTACCCMVVDGAIDEREIALLDSMRDDFSFPHDTVFALEVNEFIHRANTEGKNLFKDYFCRLDSAALSTEQELRLLEITLRVIRADEAIDYAEINFFKNVRLRVKVSDDAIRAHFPGQQMDTFLERDVSASDIAGYFDTLAFPRFHSLLHVDLDAWQGT